MYRWKRFLPLLLSMLPFLSSAQQHIPNVLDHNVSEEVSVHKHFLDLYKDFDLKNPYQTVRGGEVFQPLDLTRRNVSLSKEVFGYMPYWFRDRWNLVDYNLVSTIAYFSGEVLVDGTIDNAHGWPRYPGDPSTIVDVVNLINSAHANGVRVVLCITNFSGSEINTIVSNPSVRDTLIQTALRMVMAANGDGININFEGIFNSSRDDLTTFMRALADTFHTRLPGSQVSCAPTDFDTRPGDWDIVAIEPFIDLFFFQGYGYHYRRGPIAGPVGLLPNNTFWGSLNITTLIDVVLSRIDTTKVVLGVPHYGYRWPTSTGNINSPTDTAGVAFYYPDALGYIATHGRQWDAIGLNPWYRYQVGSQWYQGWYDDPQSMTHKYQFVLDRQLMGVGMWALGMDGPNHDIWDVLAVYFGDSTTVLLTPKAPTIAFIKDSSDASEGRVHVRWFSNVEPYLGGYRLHISTDPFVFGSAPLLDETALDKNSNTALITGLELDSTYYFRLVAVDTSRTKISDTSDTYGVCTGAGQRYLVVDGFDRVTASYNLPQHNFNAYYGDPIAASLRRFDSADNDAVIDSLISLTDYDGVVWFLGDESVADRTFDATEQNILKSYLEGGGKLFVTGSEIGYDLGRSASPNYDPGFYNGYLKAIYQGDRAAGLAFSGVTGSIFEGVSGTFGEVYEEDWPDYISPTGGSASALMYNASQIAAIEYAGTFGSGTIPGKLVNIGFAIETIASSATRNALMDRILDFFEGVVSVDDVGGVPQEFALLQNYPNPFNPLTTIIFEVPAGVSTSTRLVVYDLLGRELSVLVNEMKSPGQHSVSFDASGFASGVYVYRLESGNVSLSRKMLLLK